MHSTIQVVVELLFLFAIIIINVRDDEAVCHTKMQSFIKRRVTSSHWSIQQFQIMKNACPTIFICPTMLSVNEMQKI
jgi:hypothetical protein